MQPSSYDETARSRELGVVPVVSGELVILPMDVMPTLLGRTEMHPDMVRMVVARMRGVCVGMMANGSYGIDEVISIGQGYAVYRAILIGGPTPWRRLLRADEQMPDEFCDPLIEEGLSVAEAFQRYKAYLRANDEVRARSRNGSSNPES